MKRSRSVVTTVLFAAVVGGAPSALAAPPTTVVEAIDITFVETEVCADFEPAFDVPGRVVGTRTTRTFDRPGTGVQQVSTVNALVTFSANGKTVTTRDVGADVTRRQPDGTLVLSVTGQVPVAFKGVLKIDPDTGAVLLEPQRQVDVDAFCAALAPPT